MSENDHIGVVRPHRWISAEAQRKRLEADGCRTIVALDGKKDTATREELVKLTRETTTIKVVHAFLLADPKRRRLKGGLKADFLSVLKRLICKPPGGRGGTVKDVASGLTTADKEHKRMIIAGANDHITRDGKGLKSALNGARNRGRQRGTYSKEAWAEAYSIWRNTVDYPEWDDVDAAYLALDKKYNHEHPFTRYRASRKWPGGRKSKKR
jgi:hypothetical protein